MTKIGLIAAAGKPIHAGHYGLMMIASRECDEVHVYVSTSDRRRPGEVPILGTDMLSIWKKYIEPTLPSNVKVSYDHVPIASIWADVGAANENESDDTYVIYSDPVDLAQRFTETVLNKYAGYLNRNHQIKLRPVERSETVNVSGTKMRKFIADGDEKSFIENMPSEIDGEAIWDILHARAKTEPMKPKPKPRAKKKLKAESLIRNFISEVLKA
jgi:hypothetical protein